MRILILGSSGLLGSTLAPFFKTTDHEIITHSFISGNSDVMADITDGKSTDLIIKQVNPEIIINLICLSDVDECERDSEKAYKLNVLTTKNISEHLCKTNRNINLIQISTDQLYDGKNPQNEDEVKILNNYAKTKYASEQLATHAHATIIRTNFFGKSNNSSKQSFSDWVIKEMGNKNVKFFNDVYFSPLTMKTLSKLLIQIINKGLKQGVYNVGSHKGMSKYKFASTLAKNLNHRLGLERSISVEEVKLLATRPKGMLLDSSKFESDFGIILPNLESEIKSLF